MTEEMTKYRCSVCGVVNHANSEDILVTCENGHNLVIGVKIDEEGCVETEDVDAE